MKSIKWTTVSFLAASALGAGAFAFAGCTVTSGEPTDSGGVVKDGGSGTDGGGTDGGGDTDSGSATCEGNTKQAKKLVSDACQNCLNANCCSELKGCFNKDVSGGGGDAGGDAGTSGDCNEYAECIAFCYSNQGGSQACLDECNAGAPAVVDEYDKLITCGETKGCKTPCGL